jgi:hypothetical protein
MPTPRATSLLCQLVANIAVEAYPFATSGAHAYVLVTTVRQWHRSNDHNPIMNVSRFWARSTAQTQWCPMFTLADLCQRARAQSARTSAHINGRHAGSRIIGQPCALVSRTHPSATTQSSIEMYVHASLLLVSNSGH